MQSSIPATEQKEALLFEVISEIQSQSTDFSWFISSETLVSVLNLKKETYYKILYSLRNSEFNPATLRGFHQSEGKYLCQLLTRVLHLEGVEKEFASAGIYFGEDCLSELQNSFIDLFELTVSKHKLDKELLLLLCSATIKFEDAFDSYFEDKFDTAWIIERAISQFMQERMIDPYYGAEDFLRVYIEDQIRYKKIKFGKLKSEYRDRYYYELYGRFRETSKSKKNQSKYSREINQLLQFFGLDDSANRKTLKIKYKELLKMYHPDINKTGLEQTKLIIVNYKKLHHVLPE